VPVRSGAGNKHYSWECSLISTWQRTPMTTEIAVAETQHVSDGCVGLKHVAINIPATVWVCIT